MLRVILEPADEQSPPWDFEDTAKSPADISLERHGCLLLLTARFANSVLLNTEKEKTKLSLFPDLSTILSNFLGSQPNELVEASPTALVDSLLSLAQLSSINDSAEIDENDLKNLLLALSACTSAPGLRSLDRVSKILETIFSHLGAPSQRYTLIQHILSDPNTQWARGAALKCLKHELQHAISDSPFTSSTSFTSLFDPLFTIPAPLGTIPSDLSTITTDSLIEILTSLRDPHISHILLTLNLYLYLLKSEQLRARLELDTKLNDRFSEQYLAPLKNIARLVVEDDGAAKILGDSVDGMEQVLMNAKGAGMTLGHVIGLVEEAMEKGE